MASQFDPETAGNSEEIEQYSTYKLIISGSS